jgi:hypothetical protein
MEYEVCFITAYEVYYDRLKEDYPTLNVGCFIKKPVETEASNSQKFQSIKEASSDRSPQIR